ncbi:6-phosphogluconolactonase [Cumulibacter manganitolerans]|uniref:6-phosphogluconolactonase n=1 Tax=Cumulibacter manganitolerans TaxID=1884992 RepID=UPI00129710BB|nr:6-phosphogluconolactonase [Cumulibacter manganitolerans]
MSVEVEVHADAAALARSAAGRLAASIAGTLADRPVAHVVVTGGSTGVAVLRAVRDRAQEIDWSRVHVWWGDERFVGHDDAERNDVQADDALLRHIDIPAAHVHRVAAADGPFGDDPDAAAAAYAEEIAAHAGDGDLLFDVLMLGVGEEGHTASIFPHSPASDDPRPACAVRGCPKPPPTRVTLTNGTLSRAREVWLMTAGAGKAEPVAAALGGADRHDIPAAGPRGAHATRWILDEAAASRLPA